MNIVHTSRVQRQEAAKAKGEQALVEIVRSCDGKINSHNRIIVAEAFGIFSLLNLSKGKGVFLTQEQNVVFPIFLSITYFTLVALALYSLARSIHYTKMISSALGDISRISVDTGALKMETISKMFESLYTSAQKSCPRPIAKILGWRRERENLLYYLGVIAVCFSVVLWIVVLFMP